MKKVLLATTMLVGAGSMAAAEVSVSGSGRMGIVYTEDTTVAVGVDDNELAFTSRMRVNFDMSSESDSGLSFGASIRADNSAGGSTGTEGSVFIQGAFGKLSMGDVSGAAEFAVGDLAGVGLTGIGDFNENIYLSNGGATRRSAMRYEYTVGGLSFALSADNPKNDTVANVAATDSLANVISVGAKYSVADAYTFSLGYEAADIRTGAATATSIDHIIVGAEATFSGVTVKATYGQADTTAAGFTAAAALLSVAGNRYNPPAGTNDLTQTGHSASYTMNGLTVTGYYRQVDFGTPGKHKFTGIGASYDLGGGAAVTGGIASADPAGVLPSQTLADLGISFTF